MELPDTQGLTLPQKKFSLATSNYAPVIIELLKDCRTELMSVIADDEFKTLVNAVTLEKEAELIQRVVIYLENIRDGSVNLNDKK